MGLTSTGVVIANRESGARFAVHDECLKALQVMAPEAWDPFVGSFVIIGPYFDEVECAFAKCDQ